MKRLILKINKSIYYGWIIIILSATAFFLSAPGQTYSIGIFKNIYVNELGYSNTSISLAYSVATMISGFLLVFMGRAIDKFGVRKMLIIVTIMLGFTTFFNSYVSNIYMIFFGFLFLRYFGQGSMTLIPNTLVPQWFDKRRALAVSLASLGGLLAMLLVPSLNLWMISNIGWQSAWRVWGLILIVGFVPIVIVFTSNKPEDLGMTIENDVPSTKENVESALIEMDNTSFSLKEAVKVKEFWIVGMISMIPSMFSTALAFHFYSLMSLSNIGETDAAKILGLMAIPAFLMPFISKIIVDRYKAKKILFTTISFTIISMFYLLFGVNNMVSAIIFVLFYGLGIGVQALTTSVIWPNFFGRKHLGSIRGAATVFMVVGSALGPLPFGFEYDRTESFDVSIIGMIIFTFVALFLSLLISRPIKKETIT